MTEIWRCYTASFEDSKRHQELRDVGSLWKLEKAAFPHCFLCTGQAHDLSLSSFPALCPLLFRACASLCPRALPLWCSRYTPIDLSTDLPCFMAVLLYVCPLLPLDNISGGRNWGLLIEHINSLSKCFLMNHIQDTVIIKDIYSEVHNF